MYYDMHLGQVLDAFVMLDKHEQKLFTHIVTNYMREEDAMLALELTIETSTLFNNILESTNLNDVVINITDSQIYKDAVHIVWLKYFPLEKLNKHTLVKLIHKILSVQVITVLDNEPIQDPANTV